MKLHEIMLSEPFAKAKKDGIKPFEIRKNDRDFKVGDLVKYNIVENYTEPYPPNRTLTRESQNKELTNYFDNRVFKIKYITNYEQKDGYVVFVDESYYIGEQYEKRSKRHRRTIKGVRKWVIKTKLKNGSIGLSKTVQ